MSANIKKIAIIVAGGSGTRMGTDVPKQFLEIHGKPILVHTIEKFLLIDNIKILLAIPQAHQEKWGKIQRVFFPQNSQIQVVIGGDTRFQSVKNALDSIKDKKGVVAVHDAVRPLVALEDIMKTYDSAIDYKAVVLAVPSKDSVRIVQTTGQNVQVDRTQVYCVQTPQTFDLEILKKAYLQEYKSIFTDDASVVESTGEHIHIVEGKYTNIKITTPEDLILAQSYLK
ncbi:MAG: 2-C-methyl-D-erythritol 4-phosphate cytidylyltransferase [Leadbetterella sp.]